MSAGAIIVPAALAFIGLSFSLGSNDVSNTVSTSIGSRALTIPAALVLACVMEVIGVMTIARGVSDTIRYRLVDPVASGIAPEVYAVGMLASSISCFVFLFSATLLGLPCSTTHAVVVSVLTFGIIQSGWQALNVPVVVNIIISWFTSPLAGALVGFLFYFLLSRLLIQSPFRSRNIIFVYPVCFGVTFSSSIAFVLALLAKQGSFSFLVPVIVFAVTLVASTVVCFFVFRRWRVNPMDCSQWVRHIVPPSDETTSLKNEQQKKNNNDGDGDDGGNHGAESFVVDDFDNSVSVASVDEESVASSPTLKLTAENGGKAQFEDDGARQQQQQQQQQQQEERENIGGDDNNNGVGNSEEQRPFVLLMIMTCATGALGHAANDSANALSAFAVVLEWTQTGSVAGADWPIPEWVFAITAVCLVAGITLMGMPVIRTMGTKITRLNYIAGFSAQLASALLVLLATLLGLPVSTTHIIVGSITGCGFVGGNRPQWKELMKILAGWFGTIVVAIILTMCIFLLLRLGL